jgi:hypothetical protein
MKYDQLVEQYLKKSYFGDSVNEEEEPDNITGAEAKAMQDMLNKTIEMQRGGKKKNALQMVDVNQLSPAGREFLETLIKATELYQQGSKIKGDPELRGDIQLDMESNALKKMFGDVRLEYVGRERKGKTVQHAFRYPSPIEGDVGVPFDKDGFRIEAQVSGDIDSESDTALYPLDQFDVVNWFGKGGPLPISTRGKITRG